MPEFVKAIGAARFGVMAGVAAALTAFFLYVAGAITEAPKSILYSGLEPRDASQVTAKLDAMNVAYELKGDGGTIMVAADQVTKLRMSLAQENLPAAGVGYEIFDKSDAFGTTAFVQNINRLRALEGELSRSIDTIEGIESARVHLVVPERQIFSRDEQTPSASVVVKTRSRLGQGQVQAIQHLVAAAVAGLGPDRVAIVDDRGTLLAGGDDKSAPDAAAAGQESHTSEFEDRLRQRIESIIGSVVGAGHVRVQVSADMNYNHLSETSETYDPDSKVVRSTQTVEQNATDTNAAGSSAVSVANALPNSQSQGSENGTKSASGRTEETTNYEINKTTKTSTVDGGVVKRLSVAVVVDGSKADPDYHVRTPKELAQIEALVKSTMGYDAGRGDQVQVSSMAFAPLDTGPAIAAPAPLLGLDGTAWFKIIEIAILSLTALLVGFFVARPLISRMFQPLALARPQAIAGSPAAAQLSAPQAFAESDGAPSGQVPALAPPPRESMIDISRIEGQVRESSVRKVGEVVQSHPEEALAILRTWLHQPV
ncbi:MAG: flagellar M-ring protein FliF [Alphaproteobacteria bacterium]|nr:flagellar M-ring protein FliF [Alphaproteobacteria bacterium]MBV9694982.1 flagellar M-ring protein FliF [Alphaproteobacteria bacterium]